MDETLSNRNADREGRINARRKRIEERLKTLREGENTGGSDSQKKEEIGKGKQQILESKRKLFRIKYKTDQDVTSVRVAGDDKENHHRMQEESIRQDLRTKLLTEAEQSSRQNAAVAMRWADLFSIEVPQDLYQEIEKQRKACDKIISSKDKLIQEIKSELKKKDDEFVKTLKRQAEDTDTLLQYMSRQFVEMQNAYREELDEIESGLLLERSELLELNAKEMQELMDRRSKLEQDYMDRYLASVELYQKQLEELRISDAEEYHILKIRLETDIQNLEQHLEAMRATYQLNTEKLEYNYRVLVERSRENSDTIKQQKNKVTKQRDQLIALKQKYAEADKKMIEENAKLTDEYKRITEQFKDLQNKFRHFEYVDNKKYKQVWEMHSEELEELAKKVLDADRVITEQQLGWSWNPPDEDYTASNQPADASNLVANTSETGEEGENAAANGAAEINQRIREPTYAGALGLLLDEAGFLIEAKTRNMLDRLPKDDAGFIKVDSILRSLGVTDGASFDALMDALRVDSNVEVRARGVLPGKTSPDAVSDPSRPVVLIHPDDAIKRLKAYVEAENSMPMRAGIGGPTRAAGMMRRAAEKEREYWHRISGVVSARTFRVWKSLERQLQEYRDVLEGRATALREVEAMQQQNVELRTLLNQYLSSNINQELKIPPTQII